MQVNILISFLWMSFFCFQTVPVLAENKVVYTGNPLLPGYFADPTIKKFGDTYYIYATTDGVKLASGEPTVWISKDFLHWFNYKLQLDLPEGLNNCWAPDVLQAADGKFYYIMGNCEMGCNIYAYVSESPMGPFSPVNNGKPVIPVGTSREHLPALDAQYLVDEDGTIHAYFGTWCTSFGGMGYARINPLDMYTIEKTSFIPIQQIPLAFEAAYPLKYKNRYFLMYSSGDCRLSSYAVHYSVSDSPEGPFVYGKNNPILETNSDGTIDGPGHHSVLMEGDDFYMLYHRHDNPHSTGGEFRQVCVDKMFFSDSVTIEKVIPTHSGVPSFVPGSAFHLNIARNATATASSYYHLVSMPTRYDHGGYDYQYLPANATDDDNGTMWKAASSALPQTLEVDLGSVFDIKRITTEFEYSTYYYQYRLEVSKDRLKWEVFADRVDNRTCGMPMIDDAESSARYIRLVVTGTQKTGVIPAVWNIKAYTELFTIPPFVNEPSAEAPGEMPNGDLLVDFDVRRLKNEKFVSRILNHGTLNGNFIATAPLELSKVNGVKALRFDGENYLKLDRPAPERVNWNAPFTASVWVYNPELGNGEGLLAWNSRENMLQSSYAALMYGKGNYGAMAHGDGAVDLAYKNVPAAGKWHHIVVTFDGALENVYVNGQLNTQTPLSLFVECGDVIIGSTGMPHEHLSGYIANARLYNRSMNAKEVQLLMKKTSPIKKRLFSTQ